jgi:hypothetical protein
MTAGAIARWAATVAGATTIIGIGLGIGLAAGGAQPPAPASGSALAPVADGGAPSPNVKITFQTIPPEKAVVSWGKKPIGIINRLPKKPLIIERPRDSGPMDVVVRAKNPAKNYLPVRTRAYTFSDTKVLVKLTLVEEKKTLFGYREEIPDGGLSEGGRPDGGAPPPPPVGPPAPAPAPVPAPAPPTP